MGPLSQRRYIPVLLLALSAILANCSSTALMDSVNDDMAGATSGSSKTNSACSACFDTSCAWETTECAADPTCATWLMCAKEVGVGENGGVDPTGLSSCPIGNAPTAQRLRDSVASCVTLAGCCNVRAEADPSGNLGGNDSSGAGGGAYSPDAGEEFDTAAPGACPDGNCSCIGCIKEPACLDLYLQCKEDPLCLEFLQQFAQCEQSFNTEQNREDCLFLAVANDSSMKESMRSFLESVGPCLTQSCLDHCAATSPSCHSCQKQSCLDHLKSIYEDTDALLATWCRSYCKRNPTDQECPQKCTPYLQAAQDILQPYGECVATNCSEACATN